MFDFDWKVYCAFALVLFLMALPVLRRKFYGQIAHKDANELLNLLRSDQAPLLIDIRSAKAFDIAHIPHAINIPCNTPKLCLDKVLENIQSKPEQNPVVLICESDLASSSLYKQLLLAGVNNIYVLTGGFNYWKRKGLQVIRGKA